MVSEVRLWLDFKNDCIVCLRNASYLCFCELFCVGEDTGLLSNYASYLLIVCLTPSSVYLIRQLEN